MSRGVLALRVGICFVHLSLVNGSTSSERREHFKNDKQRVSLSSLFPRLNGILISQLFHGVRQTGKRDPTAQARLSIFMYISLCFGCVETLSMRPRTREAATISRTKQHQPVAVGQKRFSHRVSRGLLITSPQLEVKKNRVTRSRPPFIAGAGGFLYVPRLERRARPVSVLSETSKRDLPHKYIHTSTSIPMEYLAW